MSSEIQPVQIPDSYATLSLRHIRVFHHPSSSQTATPVVIVKLWRPDNANAFTNVMKEDLIKVYEMFDADNRVKCVLLTAEGKFFCAGADLSIGFPGQGTGPDTRKKTERDNEHRDG